MWYENTIVNYVFEKSYQIVMNRNILEWFGINTGCPRKSCPVAYCSSRLLGNFFWDTLYMYFVFKLVFLQTIHSLTILFKHIWKFQWRLYKLKDDFQGKWTMIVCYKNFEKILTIYLVDVLMNLKLITKHLLDERLMAKLHFSAVHLDYLVKIGSQLVDTFLKTPSS